MSRWTLFSNHGHVLVVLSRDPDARLRDVAQVVGITERAVQKIVRDLQDGGMISVEKKGRRNRYQLHAHVPLRHALEAHCSSGALLGLINEGFAGVSVAEQVTDVRTGGLSTAVAAPPEPSATATMSEPEPVINTPPSPKPEPEPQPEPQPKPEPVPEPEPEPVPEPEPEPEPRTAPEPNPDQPNETDETSPPGKRGRKKKSDDDPVDQGSLF